MPLNEDGNSYRGIELNVGGESAIGDPDLGKFVAESLKWRIPDTSISGVNPDLPPWPHSQLREATIRLGKMTGGLVVSSGGTTGAPKLTVISPDLGVARVTANWQPLQAGDILLNLFSAGKMWGAQYFYNAVALHARSMVAPMGSLSTDEFDEWSAEIGNLGVTAIAGAPNTLVRFAQMAARSDLVFPIRTVIWSGEPMTAPRRSIILAAFPEARFWGNYGSIETFVIGISRPDCDLGAIHLLPGQLLEFRDDGALLTRFGDGWPSPAVRLQLGDRMRSVTCSCGEADAFIVTGRTDDMIKLYGACVNSSHVLDIARSIAGVEDAQLVIYHDPDVRTAVSKLRLLVTGRDANLATVRLQVVRGIEDLQIIDTHVPNAFTVDRSSDLTRSPRTRKVLPTVWSNNDNED